MPPPKPRLDIFYGWWIVAVGAICLLLAGGIAFYSFGAFFAPLIDEFGWSRAQLSLAITIACVLGLAGPLVGLLVDRYGARIVMAIGALVTGAAFALLGFTTSLWYFYVLYLVLASGQAGILNIPVAQVVSNWFSERRGLAIGITLTGFGLGGLTMLPLASYLISALGWRATYHLLGVLICIVLIPLSILIIKDRPQDMGLLPDGRATKAGSEPPSSTGWTLGGALKAPAYWLIMGSLTLAYLGTASIITHVIPFLQDKGLSLQLASTILALATGVSIIGRVAAGYLADRISVKYVTIFSFLLQAGGIALLLGAGSMTMIWAFVIVFGLAMGGMFALEPLLISRYFGLTSFGAIYGGLWAVVALGFATGPPLAGYIFDTSGSYNLAFVLFIAATILAIALILFLRSPQPPKG